MKIKMSLWCAALAGFASVLPGFSFAAEKSISPSQSLPPAITRRAPAVVRVDLVTEEREATMMAGFDKDTKYTYWTFNGTVPGPLIRVRVKDTLELRITNPATSVMHHNVDFHAVTGPGGGGKVTLVNPGETKAARFKMLNPGLYVYHCAAPPVSHHIANGMYGMILVEPEEGLPPVDREFYVMQGDFYTKEEFGAEGSVTFDPSNAEAEHPTYIVFNGRVGALQEENSLKAKVGERVRIFFGNGGPNLVSSFHVIGEIFDRVYHEGSFTEPLKDVQTTLVPAGGSTMVEFDLDVPGDFTLVDHAIFRIQKGAIGTLHVDGKENPEIYSGQK